MAPQGSLRVDGQHRDQAQEERESQQHEDDAQRVVAVRKRAQVHESALVLGQGVLPEDEGNEGEHAGGGDENLRGSLPRQHGAHGGQTVNQATKTHGGQPHRQQVVRDGAGGAHVGQLGDAKQKNQTRQRRSELLPVSWTKKLVSD